MGKECFKSRQKYGKSIVLSRKKYVPEVFIKYNCQEKHRKKCHQKFSDAKRLDISQRYHKLETNGTLFTDKTSKKCARGNSKNLTDPKFF